MSDHPLIPKWFQDPTATTALQPIKVCRESLTHEPEGQSLNFGTFALAIIAPHVGQVEANFMLLFLYSSTTHIFVFLSWLFHFRIFKHFALADRRWFLQKSARFRRWAGCRISSYSNNSRNYSTCNTPFGAVSTWRRVVSGGLLPPSARTRARAWSQEHAGGVGCGGWREASCGQRSHDWMATRGRTPEGRCEVARLLPRPTCGGAPSPPLTSVFPTHFQPNAILKTFLPSKNDGMSQHQKSLYLKLILGLPIPALFQNSPICPCGQQNDGLGCHRIHCRQNAGKAFKPAHEVVVQALKRKHPRTGFRTVDNDNELRANHAHLTSKKRGDLATFSNSDFRFYDSISRLPRPEAIADVKMVSLVNSQGTWTPARSRHKDKIENPGLVQQEQIKINKHAAFYSPIGYAFFSFVVSCFGSFGPTAVRCLFSLADLKLLQHGSFLLDRASTQWRFYLLALSIVLFATVRSPLVWDMQWPRPLLCVCLDYLVFLFLNMLLALFLLETALAQQILLFFHPPFPMLPLWACLLLLL